MNNTHYGTQPPLQHPVPTHPHYIPEPPSTPVSPQGYMRFTGTPPVGTQNVPPPGPQHFQGYPQHQPFVAPGTSSSQASQQSHIPNYAAAWGVDTTTAQLGMQLGQSAVAAGQEYVQKNVSLDSESGARVVYNNQLFFPPVYRCHTSFTSQASFQRLEFVRAS